MVTSVSPNKSKILSILPNEKRKFGQIYRLFFQKEQLTAEEMNLEKT